MMNAARVQSRDVPSTHVVDAAGASIPVAHYRRILSGSSISDAILPELVATDRIVGVTWWYVDSNPHGARLTGKQRFKELGDLERIVALEPDLVIVSNYLAEPGRVERLRERGIPVFDLGPMLGKRTLEKNMRDLGSLLDQRLLGERLAQAFQRRMEQVAAHVPPEKRKRALYLNRYDTQLHGGTVGSSYHDVITAAGLIDVAAPKDGLGGDARAAWPRYRPEDVLAMDPEIIVTVRGKGVQLCAMPGIDRVKACRIADSVLELDEWQLNDPGPGMLVTAEQLCDQAYSSRRAIDRR
jgi:ABC-type Fe3+-hydroxamate transport system substrate-binding protein